MFTIADSAYESRLILGTANYPSPQVLHNAILQSGAQMITVSIRRQVHSRVDNVFWEMLQALPVQCLPNTAGCHCAKDAIITAQLAREVFNTSLIKLEVIGDDYTLQPDPFELVDAARELIDQGFDVLPYCTDDLVLCEKLVAVGCKVLMPWAAPIGSGRGVNNPYALQLLRERFKDITLIVDAGIGRPSDATQIMQLGFDAVLLNTAVSSAIDPVVMAQAFCHAVKAGRKGFEAGMIPVKNMAKASTCLIDKPQWNFAHG